VADIAAPDGAPLSKTRNGLSWKTVSHIRTAFGTIIEAAVMQDLLTDNVVRKTRLARRGPVEEKSPIESETVIKLIEKLAEPSRSIASLLVMTGLRIGELLALRWQDVVCRSRTGFYRSDKRSTKAISMNRKASGANAASLLDPNGPKFRHRPKLAVS